MSHPSETGQILGREHRDSLALLARVEQSLQRPRSGSTLDPDAVRLVRSLSEHMASDLTRHFKFEERELIPRMVAAGEADLAELLAEEHDAIRAVASELAPLVGSASDGTLEAEGCSGLRRLALVIAYSLGNLIFGGNSRHTYDTAILEVRLSNDRRGLRADSRRGSPVESQNHRRTGGSGCHR